MQASRFERPDSILEVTLQGHTYCTDLANDSVSMLFQTIQQTLKEAESSLQHATDEQEAVMKVKEVYEQMIDTFLQCEASKEIFAEEDSISFHEDVFQYLTREYQDYRRRKARMYSSERLHQK